MKIRALLKWFNDALRPPHIAGAPGEDVRPDPADALVNGREPLPVNSVPSQQDARPDDA